LLIDRLGQYLYVSVYDSQEIAQYRIGGDGGLTELLPRIPTSPSSSSAEAPEDINLDPLNRFVYAVLLDGTERLYQIDSDGRLSEVSPAPVTPGSARIYFDPTGRFLYTPENVRDENHSIYQYRIAADGSLSPVAPASTIQGAAGTDLVFSGGDMPVQPIPAALYIGHADGQISQYTIDSDGSLNPMTPATVAANGSGVFGLATSASAEYLYATTQSGSGADQIAQFSIGTDGTLSALVPPNVTVANRVGGIAIDLTEEWVYALAPQADVAFEHRVGSGGTLSPASTPTSTMGDDPTGITVHPNGKYAYVADLDGNSVSVYEMNLANGAGVADALGDLELLATEPAGERLTGDVGVTPDGRYLYAVNAGKFTNVRFGNLAQFEIAADGTLSSLMPATIDVGPDTSSVAIAVHPSGLYVYVVNGNDDTIAQFAVGADGTLSQVGTLLATGVTPVAVAIEPSGRFLYVADGRFAPAIPAIAVFAIDQADGRLAALPGSPFATYSSRHSSIAITGSRR
jgi:6-phosphogluconolactonase (cycloisomerase 2 family)